MASHRLEARGALARYRLWLTERPLARSTRVSYGTKVSRFVRWLSNSHVEGSDDLPPNLRVRAMIAAK